MDHALVVDDSRTARAVLKQMLRKEACKADAVASAEAAIEYLQSQKPNVIFMDHMMPGMDGFAAVRMIRSDPATQHIPIVMYTSRDGEVFVGQAQALGATDILCKPATQDELRATLQRISAAAEARPPVRRSAPPNVVPIETASNEPVNEQAVEQLDYENYDEPPADRSAQSFVAALPPPELPNDRLLAARIKLPSASMLGPLLLLGCLVATLAWASFKFFSLQDRETELLKTQEQLLESLQWTTNQAGYYGWNELPMAGRRLELLRELLNNLQLSGFRGTLLIEGHVGQYCLVRNGRGGFVRPNSQLPIADCDVIGDDTAVAMQRSGAQSAAFKEFLKLSTQRDSGRVDIQVVARGASQPQEEYPAGSAVRTAGDWNRSADLNNRVEMYLIAD